MEEIRKTKWLHHGAFGVSKYRIHKKLSGGSWSQRHEYEMNCGKIEIGEWIPSNPGWVKDDEKWQ